MTTPYEKIIYRVEAAKERAVFLWNNKPFRYMTLAALVLFVLVIVL